jgi:hypothetical protein
MLNLLIGVFIILKCLEEIKRNNKMDFDAVTVSIAVAVGLITMMIPKIMLLLLIISVSISIGHRLKETDETPEV